MTSGGEDRNELGGQSTGGAACSLVQPATTMMADTRSARCHLGAMGEG